jgi:hypothetical protein
MQNRIFNDIRIEKSPAPVITVKDNKVQEKLTGSPSMKSSHCKRHNWEWRALYMDSRSQKLQEQIHFQRTICSRAVKHNSSTEGEGKKRCTKSLNH